MTWAERLRFAPAPPTGMVVLRVLLYFAVAGWALTLDAAEVAETAALHWEPRSVFVLLPGPPSEGVVLAAQGVLALAAVAAALGWHGRVAQLAVVPPFVLLAGLLDAVLGTLAHRTALVVILAVALAPAPLEVHASLDRRRALRRGRPAPPEVSARWAWPVGLSQLLVVLVYFGAGLAKLAHGGLAWLEPASFQRWTWVKLDRIDDPSPIGLLIAESPLLAFASAAGILAFQLSIVLVLVFPWFRPLGDRRDRVVPRGFLAGAGPAVPAHGGRRMGAAGRLARPAAQARAQTRRAPVRVRDATVGIPARRARGTQSDAVARSVTNRGRAAPSPTTVCTTSTASSIPSAAVQPPVAP